MIDKTTAVKVGFGAAVLGIVALAAPLLWALASAGVAGSRQGHGRGD